MVYGHFYVPKVSRYPLILTVKAQYTFVNQPESLEPRWRDDMPSCEEKAWNREHR